MSPEVLEIIAIILSSVGGAAVVIAALSLWIGKVWANRILERDKANYSVKIEQLRKELEIEARNKHLVFSNHFEEQFKVYNELWKSLVELKSGVDDLWTDANRSNFLRFVRSLKQARHQIQKSAILIEPEDYSMIMKAIEDMGDYQVGKFSLLFSPHHHELNETQMQEIIERNRCNRERILEFTDHMLSRMREQIGGVSSMRSANQSR